MHIPGEVALQGQTHKFLRMSTSIIPTTGRTTSPAAAPTLPLAGSDPKPCPLRLDEVVETCRNKCEDAPSATTLQWHWKGTESPAQGVSGDSSFLRSISSPNSLCNLRSSMLESSRATSLKLPASACGASAAPHCGASADPGGSTACGVVGFLLQGSDQGQSK